MEYLMLPQHHPLRVYFESHPVSDYDLMAAPFHIENYEQHIAQLEAELAAWKPTNDDIRQAKKKLAAAEAEDEGFWRVLHVKHTKKELQDATIRNKGRRFSMEIDLRKYRQLLAAWKMRQEEAVYEPV